MRNAGNDFNRHTYTNTSGSASFTRGQHALREEAKLRYRCPENIKAKWVDQYGNVSRDNDYQRNRACVTEVFNMLDVVMDICIEDFRKEHSITGIDIGRDKRPIYTYALENGDSVTFSVPTTFARRVRVLRLLGYALSDELSDETRLLRNETTHGNQTVVLQHMKLGYGETMHAMLTMADGLITLGKMDVSVRIPSFDMLRVKEGDTLLSGAYTIGELVGEGGMSRVYSAVQNRGGRKFAIKELKPGTYSEERIRNECDILSRLHHPGIPQIYDSFSENDTFYIVMSLIQGVTLKQYWKQCLEGENTAQTRKIRTAIIRQLCDVLQYLHSDKVSLVFADLSPDNILVSGDEKVSLIDFGSMVVRGERQAVPSATLGYSAPEVFAGKCLDQRTDVYSFGFILWFLFTGLSPQEYPGDRMLNDRFYDDGDYPEIDRGTAEVIARCTERSPAARFNTIAEAAQSLMPGASAAGSDLQTFRAKESKETGEPASKTSNSQLPEETAQAKHSRPFGLSRRFLKRAAAGALLAAGAAALVLGFGRFRGAGGAQIGNEAAETADAAESRSESATLISLEEAGLSDHVMDWRDDRLESEMRRITGISQGDIRLQDVWERTELSLDNCGISNIEALGELRNLRHLSLMSNRIGDVTSLADLTELEDLNLQGNRVEDIQALKPLQNLKTLDVGGNRIGNISVIESFPALTSLAVNDNPISEEHVREVLEAGRKRGIWSGLRSLNLCGLGFSDCGWISGVADSRHLESLYLSDNNLSDITPLSSLTNLRALYLKGNRLDDISAMAAMPHLVEVDIQFNPVEDLSPIGGAKELVWLDMKECEVEDLSAIQNCALLTSIDCSGNQIFDLSPLTGLVRLSYLDARGNALSGNVDSLKNLTALTFLDLRDNEITDVSALAELSSLRYLYLEGNPIEDYSPVRNYQ